MELKHKTNTYKTLFHWHSFRLRLVVEGIGIGITAGLLIEKQLISKSLFRRNSYLFKYFVFCLIN
ncbi:multisubunit Na+/H+ antiporter MnhE subunit [Clostridium beijerinckii]|jgi:multisubunit Na+/H+ antiporter MnhE subunit|uniref:Uncharacterized protein n=2 Tax=Clostridium TaxID=1485 RepID=A0AAV3V8T7_9CLOT|nr:hypothetical protein CLBIJ_32670 [Clostridium beijerinckii]AQS18304.1 hypothetical protein X276_27170 [Clostridium beijerinckii NRRL B-598]AVK47136.1 hypothetical protein AXY43_03385 [Clostridium sp. MF28]OVE68970.1 hypothetical protein CCS79_08565 [Clostridium diolis]MBA2885455.1 multisubunit Na+/H+ antiporter MnhE subunit [Clostridium beijerinckii]